MTSKRKKMGLYSQTLFNVTICCLAIASFALLLDQLSHIYPCLRYYNAVIIRVMLSKKTDCSARSLPFRLNNTPFFKIDYFVFKIVFYSVFNSFYERKGLPVGIDYPV